MRRLIGSILFALFILCPLALSAQIPPRKTVTVAVASVGGTRRLLLATPNVEAGAEPARAVELADAMRRRIAERTAGRYQVVSREALNRVLTSAGYDADAPLSDVAVRALGTQLQAAYVVCSTLRLESDGRLSVVASLAPPGDAGATRQTVTQEAGQSLDAVAVTLVDQLLTEVH